MRDSDGTLILASGPPTGSVAHAKTAAAQLGKPLFILDLRQNVGVQSVVAWARAHGVRTINITGPRESQVSGIYELAQKALRVLLL